MKELAKLFNPSDYDWSNLPAYDWSNLPEPRYLPPYSPRMVEIELQSMAIQLEWLKEKEENGTR